MADQTNPHPIPDDLAAAARPLVDLLARIREKPPGILEASAMVAAIKAHGMAALLRAVVLGWVRSSPKARETLLRWIS
jgi:hypothetical protein